MLSTHKLGGFLLYPQAGRVPPQHLNLLYMGFYDVQKSQNLQRKKKTLFK